MERVVLKIHYLLLVLFVLFGCSSQPPRGQLLIDMMQQGKSFDPSDLNATGVEGMSLVLDLIFPVENITDEMENGTHISHLLKP